MQSTPNLGQRSLFLQSMTEIPIICLLIILATVFLVAIGSGCWSVSVLSVELPHTFREDGLLSCVDVEARKGSNTASE